VVYLLFHPRGTPCGCVHCWDNILFVQTICHLCLFGFLCLGPDFFDSRQLTWAYLACYFYVCNRLCLDFVCYGDHGCYIALVLFFVFQTKTTLKPHPYTFTKGYG